MFLFQLSVFSLTFCNVLLSSTEKNHGEGIYFSSSMHGTEKLWRGLADEEYLYFTEEHVLTGKSTITSPGLIGPPETLGGDPLTLCDSMKGDIDTCVIFNGH